VLLPLLFGFKFDLVLLYDDIFLMYAFAVGMFKGDIASDLSLGFITGLFKLFAIYSLFIFLYYVELFALFLS